MKRKFIGILILLLGAVLMAGIVYVILFGQSPINDFLNRFKDEQTITIPPAENTPSSSDNSAIVPAVPDAAKPARVITVDDTDLSGDKISPQIPAKNNFDKNDLMRLAASFAERFGSYSNQSNFSNILDLKLFMSQRMKGWADNYVREQRSRPAEQEIYYGITTKAIAEEILAYDDDLGQAVVSVSARRRESTGTTGNTSDTFTQDIKIEFIKEGGSWKADAAFWQ